MRHNLLSDAAVKSKTKPPGYYLDGRGLYLQVAPKGGRSWLLRYTFAGKTREMGLGSVYDLGLARARDLAQEQRELIRQGIDPLNHRAAQLLQRKAAEAQAALVQKTFEACAREYHEKHAENWKNEKHGDQWINSLSNHVFGVFGQKAVGDVGKPDMLEALTPLWREKAETATRLFQRIRTVINYAAAKDYCKGLDQEFWEQLKLALGANDRAKKVEHHASCPYPAVSALLASVKQGAATDMVKLAFEFTVLTCARSAEARGARWSEFDPKLTTWTVPKERMKAGREHRVPLSGRVRELLLEAQKLLGIDSNSLPDSLVFPNPKGKPYSDMVFTQLMRRMKLNYTMHGFRASFRTWGMEATQYPDEMLEFALAHVVGDQTVRAYARSDMVERRKHLMEDWAAYSQASS